MALVHVGVVDLVEVLVRRLLVEDEEQERNNRYCRHSDRGFEPQLLKGAGGGSTLTKADLPLSPTLARQKTP